MIELRISSSSSWKVEDGVGSCVSGGTAGSGVLAGGGGGREVCSGWGG